VNEGEAGLPGCGPAVAPLGDAEIVVRVWDALDAIADPCMKLSGRDLSVRDMGLINRIERRDDVVEVGVTFTDPLCKFAFRIVTAIQDIGRSLPGIVEVRVVPEYAPMWREARLNAKARRLLGKPD
jgi:metal-sulfur cluster biosynthetic enzyme